MPKLQAVRNQPRQGWNLHFLPQDASFPDTGVSGKRQLRASKMLIPKGPCAPSYRGSQSSSPWAEPPLCTLDQGGCEQALR